MAKLIGAVKFVGKFNDAVGMRSKRGKSFVRSAAASVANPRSIGQNIQRMILATAGQSIGYLKEICSNSVEGKANGNDTLSYLRSQWMRMLRVSDINSSPYNYAKKGSGIFIENPYMLSKGTLFVPQYSCNGSTFSLICEEIDGDATKPSEVFPSIAVGNQITIVAVASDDSNLEPNSPYIPVIKYCRFAFKNDFAIPFSDSSHFLNPAAIDLNKAEGDWAKLKFQNGKIELDDFIGGLDLAACALIVSNIAEKKRSTSYLALADNILGLQWPATEAYPTFGNVSTPIDVPSEVYLDNSTTASAEIAGVVSLEDAPVAVGSVETILHFNGLPAQPSEVKLNVLYGGQQYVTTDLVAGSNDPIKLPGGATLAYSGVEGAFSYDDHTATVGLVGIDSTGSWTVTGGFMKIGEKYYAF